MFDKLSISSSLVGLGQLQLVLNDIDELANLPECAMPGSSATVVSTGDIYMFKGGRWDIISDIDAYDSTGSDNDDDIVLLYSLTWADSFIFKQIETNNIITFIKTSYNVNDYSTVLKPTKIKELLDQGKILFIFEGLDRNIGFVKLNDKYWKSSDMAYDLRQPEEERYWIADPEAFMEYSQDVTAKLQELINRELNIPDEV